MSKLQLIHTMEYYSAMKEANYWFKQQRWTSNASFYVEEARYRSYILWYSGNGQKKKKMISRGWSQRKDWRQTWHIWKEIKLFCILIVVFVCLSKFTQLCITRTKFCLHENSTSIEVFKLFNVLWFHLFFLHILDSSLADFLPLPTVTSHPYLQLLAVLLAPPVASWLNSCFC